MTDKLWHSTKDEPIAFKPVVFTVDKEIFAGIYNSINKRFECENFSCSLAGVNFWAYLGGIVAVANRATVLQKKLDKAMAGLTQILTKDGQCNRAVDCRVVAERTIKEIEDIKD